MIRKCRLTIPVTNYMATDYGDSMEKVLNSHAIDRGAPVDLIEPVRSPSKTMPHVTEYTWTWYVVDKLPPSLPKAHRQSGYATEWGNVGLWDCPVLDNRPIHVMGLGSVDIETAEELALEMLAAVEVARERMKTDVALQD